MPGPNSSPNGTQRETGQMIPAKLAARIAAYEVEQAANRNPKTKSHKPGSQKK